MGNPQYNEDQAAEHRSRARSAAIVEAREEGMDVVFGDAWTLMLDLDSEEVYERAKGLLARLKSTLRWTSIEMTRSRSGNVHLYVYLEEPLDLMTRQLLAAALGSDPVREVLGWDYARRIGSEEPFFFELPDAPRRKLTMRVERVTTWSIE